jgi:hypothetical protein
MLMGMKNNEYLEDRLNIQSTNKNANDLNNLLNNNGIRRL